MYGPMTTVDFDALVGGRYEIGERVGQGGMGTVFRAVDRRSRELVAVKLLNPASVLADPGNLERFAREGEALRRLDHPNIVKVLDTLEEDERRYLVMEWVGGGSLAEVVACGEVLPIERVLWIALDLCDALTRSHRLRIIHRDIKPANVLIAGDGTPKLTDFGIAYVIGEKSMTLPNVIVGTLDYLSPETLRGEAADVRADVWAFGVLLFEMLTQKRPFARAHFAETLYAIAHDPLPELEMLRPDCPVALVDLVYRMLEKQKEQRIPSVRQVGAELESVLFGRGASDRTLLAHAPTQAARAWHGVDSDPPPLRELPTEITPFIGRKTELAKLAQLLSDETVRLITILAPGGMGKSRFALEASRQAAADSGAFEQTRREAMKFASGVFFVSLAPLESFELVPTVIGEVIGLRVQRGSSPTEQLLAQLRDKDMLLVLDNFEHVLESAGLVDAILRAAPRVVVLTTSRERLGLSSETVFELGGMLAAGPGASSAEQGSAAVDLFLAHARRMRPDFELSGETAEPVAQICRLVGGMPLGIVLSASWINVLAPREIAQEIGKNLDFLETELRDVPKRQRSLRAAFDYSWNRLDEASRGVFSALCVFRGGFTRSAAEAVAGASLRALSMLTSKSLIHRDADSGRYEIHAVLRQYAEEKLAATPANHERILDLHAGYYAEFLEERTGDREPVAALDELKAEIDNVRAAWKHMLLCRNLKRIAGAIYALEDYYRRHASFVEAEITFAAAVQALGAQPATPSDEQTRLLGLSLRLQAGQCSAQGNDREAFDLGTRALSLLDASIHTRERAQVLLLIGESRALLGEREQGVQSLEQCIQLLRAANDGDGAGWALITLGNVLAWDGVYARAEHPFREIISAQVAPSRVQLLAGLIGLGLVRVGRGEFEDGRQLLARGLRMNEEFRDTSAELSGLMTLARAEQSLGRYSEAERLAKSCLNLAREYGATGQETWSFITLGNILRDQRLFADARTCFEHAQALLKGVDDPRRAAALRLSWAELALLQGEPAVAQANLAGALDWFERHDIVWGTVQARCGLGYLACHAGDFDSARERFAPALTTALAQDARPLAHRAAAGVASWLRGTGSPERSVEVLARIRTDPATEHFTRKLRVEPLLTELESELSPEAFSAALQRGNALDLEALGRASAGK
jgi:predicted ATPase